MQKNDWICVISIFFILSIAAATTPALAQMQITVTQILAHNISAVQPTVGGPLVTITQTLKNVYEGANVTDIIITDYLPMASITNENATEVDYQGAKWKTITNTIAQLAPGEERTISYDVTLPAGNNRLLLGRRVYFLGGQLEAAPQEKIIEVSGGLIQILSWTAAAALVVIVAGAAYLFKGKRGKARRKKR